MALTKTALDNELREKNLESISSLLKGMGEDALRVGGNVLAFPTTDSAGNDAWIEITVKVPKGERIAKEDGGGFGGYDGYAMAEFYTQESTRKAEEAAKRKAVADAKKAKQEAKKNSKKPTDSQHKPVSTVGGQMV